MLDIIKANKKDNSFSRSSLALPKLSKGETLIENIAVPLDDLDLTSVGSDFLGHSGVGVIVDINGPSSNVAIGDHVAYFTYEAGSLATHRTVRLSDVTPIPKGLDLVEVAASYFKTCLAHMLTARAYIIHKSSNVVISSAGTALADVISQYAASKKPNKIIGVGNGTHKGSYDHLIALDEQQLAKAATEEGFSVVYDNIAGELIAKTVKHSMFRGFLINYSADLSKNAPLKASDLYTNSLYYSEPNFRQYFSYPNERFLTSFEVFEKLEQGVIKCPYKQHKFTDYQRAIDDSYNYPHYTNVIVF